MKKDYLGANVPKLGFGFMRLPMLAENGGKEIDFVQTKRMVDLFMQKGFTYFDTAYGYLDGQAEDAIKQAVVDRYPREEFQLATKLPIWMVKGKDDPAKLFETQLKRTGAGYFDFYLLHAIGADRLALLDEADVWGFLRGLKEKGLARHIGFSFHDSAECLEGILAKHPEVEFVQLQINYVDWDSERVQSRKCYEVCRKYGKSVVVMEPVKGGLLAGSLGKAGALFKESAPKASLPSWAIRFCASLDGVVTVLSGMSTMAQMEDNVGYMEDFKPLTEAERATVGKVVEILSAAKTIPCTSCRYCVEKCPQEINIPGILAILNNHLAYGPTAGEKGSYGFATEKGGKASECLQCGVCESRCPQHIGIIDLLKEAAATLE